MEPGYPVRCECGQVHRVSAGAAGTDLTCVCGRQVEVPSLVALRRAAGEPTLSAEMQIRAMLADGELPQETECLRCGLPTDEVCHVGVVCERTEVQHAESGWKLHLIPLLLGWIRFSYRTVEAQERGRDVRFHLPLRVCRVCAGQLRRRALADMLRKVPVYARLLEKYPHAEIVKER